MRNSQNFINFLMMGGIFLVGSQSFVACGPVRALQSKKIEPSPLPAPEENLVLPLGSRIELKIVPECEVSSSGRGEKLPDFDAADENLTKGGYREHGNQWVYFRPLALPDVASVDPMRRKGHFLSWTDRLLESPILTASVVHRVWSGNNRWIVNPRVIPISHNIECKRWFLSITDLFKNSSLYQPPSVPETDTQVLSFQFVYLNGARVDFEVRFRIFGNID